MVCTSERFARSDDGKAVGFDCVTTVLDEVSAGAIPLDTIRKHVTIETSTPLHVAPQMAHVNMTFFLPALPSSRLPQSVQNIREPIADMVGGRFCCATPF